jgi:hypothetical protein
MKQPINQTHLIMKTLKNTSGITKKLAAVIIGFAMMVLTANGQFSIHNIQLGKILLSSEYIGSISNNMADEESMSVENWMTNYKSWEINNSGENNLNIEDSEKALKVENWMLKKFDNKKDNQVFIDQVEENLKVENWMLDLKDWSITKKCK